MPHVAADTPTLLLDAAEQLMLSTAYDQVSVRAICTAAHANAAAVHYHFGSKDALLVALLQDRLTPVWAQPLNDLVETDAGIAEYVDAIIDPFAALATDPLGRLHLHLLARLVLGRKDLDWTSRWFRMQPWVEVLRALVPGVDDREATRRWMFAFELILQQFGDPLAGERTLAIGTITSLRTFVTAGLAAPPLVAPPEESR